MTTPVYLDYNATSPVWPQVFQAMRPYLTSAFGNPSSAHAYGREARRAVEFAREQVSWLLGCCPEDVVFTSGGTESNNLAIEGVVRSAGAGKHVVISAFEHPAVEEVVRSLERRGHSATRLPVSRDGVVELDALESAIRPDTVLVSVMLANNEIGTIQPVAELAAFCRERGILCHTDAAQGVGKIPVDVRSLGVDLLSVAGHKMYAPKGVGALYVRRGVTLEPVLHGAGHEGGLRPGTENVASIVGLGAASERIADGLEAASRRMAEQRDRLERLLREAMGRELVIHGAQGPRLPNTSSVAVPDVRAIKLLEAARGIAAATGAACHSHDDVGSATLTAIGAERSTFRCTIRLSLGWDTTDADIDAAARELIESWRALQNSGAPADE